MTVKEVLIESVVLCFILNQTAPILWFTDAFHSTEIKSYLIYEEATKKKKNPGYSDRSPKSLLLKEIPKLYFTQIII